MRTLKSLVVAAAFGAMMAPALSAQTATGKMYFSGVNGASSRYTNSYTNVNDINATQWNVYTSPYRAQFWVSNPGSSVLPPSNQLPPAAVNAFGPTTDIFCVDFNHAATVGATTNVNYTNLGTDAVDVGVTTRSGHTLAQYLQSAWLASQIKNYALNSQTAAEINGAIWQIMSGSPMYVWTGTAWSGSGITNWMSLASTNYGSVNAANWVVVTDQNAAGQGWQAGTNGTQEFITQVTPEPATLLLLGTGLLMVFGAGYLKRPLA